MDFTPLFSQLEVWTDLSRTRKNLRLLYQPPCLRELEKEKGVGLENKRTELTKDHLKQVDHESSFFLPLECSPSV